MTDAIELDVKFQIKGKEAFLLLNAQIGYDKDSKEPYINGSAFAQKIYDLSEKGYDVTVKTNSPGGSVMDTLNIIEAILTTESNTHNIGVAGSAAGLVLISGKHRKADEGTTLMAHAAQGGDGDFRSIMSSNIQNVFNKRTKLSKEKITEIMTGAGMHWFDTKEMLENGMIDEVVPAASKFKTPATKNVMELYKVYNSINKNDQEMEKENNVFKDIFNSLFKGATDAEKVTNAMALKSENEALTVKNKALEEQVTALNKTIADSGKVAKDLEVKNLIDQAVKDGKIKEESRKSWEVMATADMKAAKETLESITKVKNKSAADIPSVKGKVEDAAVETFASLTKSNPKKLQEILESDPEKFEAMLKEYEESQQQPEIKK